MVFLLNQSSHTPNNNSKPPKYLQVIYCQYNLPVPLIKLPGDISIDSTLHRHGWSKLEAWDCRFVLEKMGLLLAAGTRKISEKEQQEIKGRQGASKVWQHII
jgi:hypothetical protein